MVKLDPGLMQKEVMFLRFVNDLRCSECPCSLWGIALWGRTVGLWICDWYVSFQVAWPFSFVKWGRLAGV